MNPLLFFADETCIDSQFFGRVCDDCAGGPMLKILMTCVKILTMGFGILATVGIIAVGVYYLTARDNESQIAKAKKRFSDILIGIILYGTMYLILDLLLPGEIMNVTADTTATTCNNPTLAKISPINGGPISTTLPDDPATSSQPSTGGSSSPGGGGGGGGGGTVPSSGLPAKPSSNLGDYMARLAVSTAWPYVSGENAGKCYNASGKLVKYSRTASAGFCSDAIKPENGEMYKKVRNWSSINASKLDTYLQDCIYYIQTIAKYSGVDSGYPASNNSAQSRLAKFSKDPNSGWVEVPNNGNTKNLKPGDIFTSSTHTMIYVGSYGGSYGDTVGASARTWVARLHPAYFKAWQGGEQKEKFRIFRYTK